MLNYQRLYHRGNDILFTGMYYAMIKAGLPYQYPPLELQIQYAINAGIGSALIRNGFFPKPHAIYRKLKIARTGQRERARQIMIKRNKMEKDYGKVYSKTL